MPLRANHPSLEDEAGLMQRKAAIEADLEIGVAVTIHIAGDRCPVRRRIAGGAQFRTAGAAEGCNLTSSILSKSTSPVAPRQRGYLITSE